MPTQKKRPAPPVPPPAVPEISKDSAPNEPMFREDRIRLAAYRLSLTREPGRADPLADWLEAEAEIDSEDAK
ncbi:MAG: DUF2934 domain-containing protein [Pseudomonadota bacterium]|nr:DUF2934 domain-containing protein [Pseudomonadota bacterium]